MKRFAKFPFIDDDVFSDAKAIHKLRLAVRFVGSINESTCDVGELGHLSHRLASLLLFAFSIDIEALLSLRMNRVSKRATKKNT